MGGAERTTRQPAGPRWAAGGSAGAGVCQARMRAVPGVSAVGRRLSWSVSSSACRARQQCPLTAWGARGVRGPPQGASVPARPPLPHVCTPGRRHPGDCPQRVAEPPTLGRVLARVGQGPALSHLPAPPVGVNVSPVPAASVCGGWSVRGNTTGRWAQGSHSRSQRHSQPPRGPAGPRQASGPGG